jgi:acetyl esterase/lipase
MHRLCPMVIATLLVGAAVSNAVAQPVTLGIVSSTLEKTDAPAGARVSVARREALLRQVAASVSAARARPPDASRLAPPPTPLTNSLAWNAAERIALWPAAPPNGTFVPATLPADWPAPFVANVASPELRVFRAQQPNGQAVLVIPGGGYQFVSVENEGADFAARLNARGYTVFVLVYRLPS